MKRISFPLLAAMALVVLALLSCEDKKKGTKDSPEPLVKILPLDSIPGIHEVHGTVGDGTSMNVLEFINDNGDTIYVQVNSQAVMGGVNVGDEMEVIFNVMKDENVGQVAVNLTSLQHMWSQRGADGKEQSLELDAQGRANTYGMSVEYDAWEVKDGLLLLHSPKRVGDEAPAIVDTFEILQLTADSLVLMNGDLMTEFERYN